MGAAEWRASEPADVERTLAVAAGLAEVLAELIRESEAVAGDATAARRLLTERLLARRPEDGPLLDLVVWFATTHDLPAARAALAALAALAARGW
jgi:hypothetical protein